MEAPAEAPQNGGSRTARELSRAEIDQLLQRNCWCVLAMSREDEPYAVPIIYGYDGHDFVFANAPGRKIEILDANPRVSLVVTEVEESGRRWQSVVVRGHLEWIEELTEKVAAFNVLRKQVPFSAQRLRDATKLARARVARIVPSEITGRAVG